MKMMSTTLIIDEVLKIQMLIDHTSMHSVGCKPMMLITINMAKTCLKVIELVVVGM
jgi:hypothetical protein